MPILFMMVDITQESCFRPQYLVKWRNYELDPRDWSAYSDLAETAVLDAWEKVHPPPQGAGKPPPPQEPVPVPARGK